MTGVEQIVKDTTLTFEQKVVALARYAENSVQVLNISEETQALRDAGIICDLFEGNVPYRISMFLRLQQCLYILETLITY